MNIDEKLPYALHVRGVDYLGSIPEFAEGLFYVQDLSSMKVAEAAEVKEMILSLMCAEHPVERVYILHSCFPAVEGSSPGMSVSIKSL